MNDLATLIDAARVAASHAHAPYSRFAVGAALRLTDGSIVTGANFENASYGPSLCAETVALACANAQGRLADVVEIAVRSEEHTSELQSLMRISYAVFCLKKKKQLTKRSRYASINHKQDTT